MPEQLLQTAEQVRACLAKSFEAEVEKEGGLQGSLLQRISAELGDPDTEVVRWIVER